MYCIYGWGLPGLLTIFMVQMNEADLSHKPWIIKPLIPQGGCFIQGKVRSKTTMMNSGQCFHRSKIIRVTLVTSRGAEAGVPVHTHADPYPEQLAVLPDDCVQHTAPDARHCSAKLRCCRQRGGAPTAKKQVPCFFVCHWLLSAGQKLGYLYIPMLILILSNWLLFLMTAYNIRRLMRGTAVLNELRYCRQRGGAPSHQQQINSSFLVSSCDIGNLERGRVHFIISRLAQVGYEPKYEPTGVFYV